MIWKVLSWSQDTCRTGRKRCKHPSRFGVRWTIPKRVGIALIWVHSAADS